MLTEFEYMAQLHKAFGHPVRLQILHELSRGEACVCHLEALTGQRQAYISQQLMRMRRSGLVIDRREGMNVFYSLANESVTEMLERSLEMAKVLSGGEVEFNGLPDKASLNCCCPKCEPETSPYLRQEQHTA